MKEEVLTATLELATGGCQQGAGPLVVTATEGVDVLAEEGLQAAQTGHERQAVKGMGASVKQRPEVFQPAGLDLVLPVSKRLVLPVVADVAEEELPGGEVHQDVQPCLTGLKGPGTGKALRDQVGDIPEQLADLIGMRIQQPGQAAHGLRHGRGSRRKVYALQVPDKGFYIEMHLF